VEPKSRATEYLKRGTKMPTRPTLPPALLERVRPSSPTKGAVPSTATPKSKLVGRENAITRGVGQKVGLRRMGLEKMPEIRVARGRKFSIPHPPRHPRRAPGARNALDNWK
jgi:hypothetical protein